MYKYNDAIIENLDRLLINFLDKNNRRLTLSNIRLSFKDEVKGSIVNTYIDILLGKSNNNSAFIQENKQGNVFTLTPQGEQFIRNGGFKKEKEEREKSQEKEEQESSMTKELRNLQLKELKVRADRIEERQKEQDELLKTSIARNKDQMLYFFVSIGVSILALLISIFK